MSLEKELKQQIMKDFGISQKDTGSSKVQIALLTQRIKELGEHMKTHPKDFHSRRGLIRILNLRRSHLDYLKKQDPKTYREVLKRLELRR
jgi:small subunit ribosomal protein S15